MSRINCDDGGASLNRVFNGPWGSNWFALGGSPFQFVQGVPPKKVSFWESKLCVCWLIKINPTKLPKGPCSTSFHSALTIGLVSNLFCPSWSCNVVYCVVSVNENKLYLFDLTRLDRTLSLSRGTWNPSWWTGEAGIHLLYCQVQERARGFLTLHLPHSRTTFSWWHSEQLSFWYLCWKLI